MEASITPNVVSSSSGNCQIYKEGLAYRLKKFDGRLGKQGYVRIFCSNDWPSTIISPYTQLQGLPSYQKVESINDCESIGLDLRFDFFESATKIRSGTPKFSCNLNKLFFVHHASIGKHQHSLALYLESAAAVYLAWETEDECLEWGAAARHLLAVLQAARPIPLFAVLKFVVQCTILPCKLGRHLNSHGLARVCLTEIGEILIVQDSFAHPVTCLPLQCLRHLKYSQNGLFVFNLGRASPYGEGELHVQMADKQEAKNLHDAILDHRPMEDQRSSKRSLTHRSSRRALLRNLKNSASGVTNNSVKLRLSFEDGEDGNAPISSFSRESSVFLSNLNAENTSCVGSGYVEMSARSNSSGNLRTAQLDNVVAAEAFDAEIELKGKASPHSTAACRKNCLSLLLQKSSSHCANSHHLHSSQDTKHATPALAAEFVLHNARRASSSTYQEDALSSQGIISSSESSKVSSTSNSNRMLDCIQCTEYSENALTKRTYSVGSRPPIRNVAHSGSNSEAKCSSTPYLPSRMKISSCSSAPRDVVSPTHAASALRSSTQSSTNTSSINDVDVFMEMSFQRPRTTSDASRYNRARGDFARPLAASCDKKSGGARAQTGHEHRSQLWRLGDSGDHLDNKAGSASSITTQGTGAKPLSSESLVTTAAKEVSDYMFMGNLNARHSHSSSSRESEKNFVLDDRQLELGASLSVERMSHLDEKEADSSSLSCDPYLFFNPGSSGALTQPTKTYSLEPLHSLSLTIKSPPNAAAEDTNYVQLDLCVPAESADSSCCFDTCVDQKSVLLRTTNHQSGAAAASHSVLPVTSYSSINFVKHST